tara:strand:+ start:626 stop:1231 length:606 start_codon:yes stop_codon:yes gene_type:complete
MPLGAAKSALLGAAGVGGAAGWEVISTTIADSSSATYNFTSIPQTYRDLRIVISAARTNVYGDRTLMYVDIGSGIDTDLTDYGVRTVMGSSSAYGSMAVVTADNYNGVLEDFPGQSNNGMANSSIIDFMDYANTSKLPTAIIWQNGVGVATYAYHHVHAGWNYDGAVGAVTGLRITRPQTTSNYFYKSPMTFTLFGRGTAD